MAYSYPLDLSFKLFAHRLMVTDANGQLLAFVRKKAFKLKEEINVYADEAQTTLMFQINADRVIDFSARYRFTDYNGIEVGSMKREGMRSLWKAHFDVFDGDSIVASIREENAWVKVADGCLSEIPFLGMLSGYLFNPTYLVKDPAGNVLMRFVKEPSFMEYKFSIHKEAELDDANERRLVLSLIMMVMLERARG